MVPVNIAKYLKVSPSYIYQQIKIFQSYNLIKRIPTHPKKDGVRAYTHFYELSGEAHNLIKGEVQQPLSACRPHHIGRIYKILRQSGSVSTDERTGFEKSWPMRGGLWYKYCYLGKAGHPTVSVYVYPKRIIVWMDKGQEIPATTIEEKEDRAKLAIHQALELFQKEQFKFGVKIEVDDGKQYGKTHYGFAVSESIIPEKQTEIKDTFIDQSVSELAPGKVEWEMMDKSRATMADRAILKVVTMEETIKTMVDPISADIARVQAMTTGNITIQQQYNQMVNFMTRALEEMAAMRKEIRELKGR